MDITESAEIGSKEYEDWKRIAELQYKNGQKLQCIYFDDGSLIDVHANPDRQMEITVVMESGMHCGIPHAIVTECDVSVQKWCLHNVQGVAFMPPETGGEKG